MCLRRTTQTGAVWRCQTCNHDCYQPTPPPPHIGSTHFNSHNPLLPNFCLFNVNSLSVSKPGGVAGPFLKQVQALAHLSLSNDLIYLQDTRLPSNSLHKQLKPFFPGWKFHHSAAHGRAGGVLLMVSPKVASTYSIAANEVWEGHIQTVDFRHQDSDTSFRHINSYLHSSDYALWKKQVDTIRKLPKRPNTFFFGDLNYPEFDTDILRAGGKGPSTSTRIAHFNAMLTKHDFQEIEQKIHTRYGYNSKKQFTSSRIDLVFHNLQFDRLAVRQPTAKVVTSAPHTVCSGQGYVSSAGNRVVHSLTKVKDGGSHISDHLPIAVRFTSSFTKKRRKSLPDKHLNSPNFLPTWEGLWSELKLNNGHWGQLRLAKTLLFDTAEVLDHTTPSSPTRSVILQAAIRLLKAIEDRSPPAVYLRRFSEYPSLLSKVAGGSCQELLDFINLEFATLAYSNQTKPVSRISALKKVLPLYKKRINCIFDPLEGRFSEDKKVITDTAYEFWKNKWSKKNVKASSRLFKKYTKTIQVKPKLPTVATIQAAIANTNDSAPGPDGIPFKAYRILADHLSPVLLGCLRDLMAGNKPPPDFNGGLLYILPKKDTGLIEDTRPLVVNNTDNRIIASTIHQLIYPAIDSILSKNQHGFKHDSSVDDNIYFFNEKFYRALEQKKNYDIMFVDIRKAFDSVAHSFILDLLRAVGLPAEFCSCIAALFHDAYCITTFLPDYSHKIFFDSGVKQGCPLSPLLFLLVMDVLDWLLTTYCDCDIRLYADDAAVGSINLCVKVGTIRICFRIFASYSGLEINIEKTVCVSTYNQSALDEALAAIDWHSVQVVGKTYYLGTLIGHLVTLDDIFSPVREKFIKRLHDFTVIKYDLSLCKRATVWNTWLLPIFSFVSKFFQIPEDYVREIDRERDFWVDPSKRFTVGGFSRPPQLAGLPSPLRHTTYHNYSLLASNFKGPPLPLGGYSWSVRIRAHRQRAADLLSSPPYHLQFPSTHTTNYIYKTLNNSYKSRNRYTASLIKKVKKQGIHTQYFDNYLNTYRLLPSWVPDYARLLNLSITHNALKTTHRNNIKMDGKAVKCFLCHAKIDSGRHLYGNCKVAKAATRILYSKLGIAPPSLASTNHQDSANRNLRFFACATPGSDRLLLGLRFILSHSIWAARCQSQSGSLINSWPSWIAEDTIRRCAKLCPTIFLSANFPNNTISNIHKINYNFKFGNSSTRTAATSATGREVIRRVVQDLDPGTFYAFTDGSALGNPGPTGSGFALFSRGSPNDSSDNVRSQRSANNINNSATTTFRKRKISKSSLQDSLVATGTAALGLSTNQCGELYAIGLAINCAMSLPSFKNHAHDFNFHVWTDSKTCYGMLTKKWRCKNRELADLVNSLVFQFRARKGAKIVFHWCPGHAGIPQNDLADQLANAGSTCSKENFPHEIDLINFVRKVGFLNPSEH